MYFTRLDGNLSLKARTSLEFNFLVILPSKMAENQTEEKMEIKSEPNGGKT